MSSIPLTEPVSAARPRPIAALADFGASRLLFPLAVAAASRVYSTLLVLLIAAARHARWPLLSSDTSPFVSWDAQWYLQIARTGYHAAALQHGPNGGRHDFAFYPAWPALIRLASLDGRLPMDVVAVVLANVLFLLATVLVFAVLAGTFGEVAAKRGVALLAFSPAAYVFTLAYSEPLFLSLAALYFLSRRRVSQPVFAAASMLARVSGMAIAVSAAVRFLANPTGRRLAILSGLAVLVAFGLWWLYIWHLTGNPTGWFEGTPAWFRVYGIRAIERSAPEDDPIRGAWLVFVAVMIGASLLVVRRSPELGVYSLAAIGLSIIGAPVASMPRHATVAFPAFGALGERLGRGGSIALGIVFGVLQFAFVWATFSFHPLGPP